MAAPVPQYLVDALNWADSRNSSRASGVASDRLDPAAAPTSVTLASTSRVAVNGRRILLPQMAKVQYLSDDAKLLLPKGLYDVATYDRTTNAGACAVLYETLRHLCGAPGVLVANRFERAGPSGNPGHYRGDIANIAATHAALAAGEPYRIDVTRQTGTYAADGTFVPRTAALEACYDSLLITWDVNDVDNVLLTRTLDPGEAPDATLAAFIARDDILDQLSDFVSARFSLNYSIRDGSFLNNPDYRWDDGDCHNDLDATAFDVSLSPYTISMIAALNLRCLANKPRLAWTRAYGTAMGLIPSATSLHHTEYMVTPVLPEDGELATVLGEHPVGEDAQVYARGCASIIAAFGVLHLANDHTYRQSDEHLKRKARAHVLACRTTLYDDEADELASDAHLATTIRTTCHPFGLSSTWALFKNGQRLKLIAEPLQIRNTSVPPPVAKVGLVVSQLDKIFALPIGKKFKANYEEHATNLATLRTQVVANAPEYSALHKHYGYTAQRVLTQDQERMVANLLPIIAGYAQNFDVDENDRYTGAMLSMILQKTIAEQGALVSIYATAFQNYAKAAQDLDVLLSGKTAKAAPATTP